ncbi:hypothetical protein D3C81_1352460 [compost metagenome]
MVVAFPAVASELLADMQQLARASQNLHCLAALHLQCSGDAHAIAMARHHVIATFHASARGELAQITEGIGADDRHLPQFRASAMGGDDHAIAQEHDAALTAVPGLAPIIEVAEHQDGAAARAGHLHHIAWHQFKLARHRESGWRAGFQVKYFGRCLLEISSTADDIDGVAIGRSLQQAACAPQRLAE